MVRSRAIIRGPPPSAPCCSCDLHACPCGNYGDLTTKCTCSESTVYRYQRRISGPLLDRIDLFVEVPRVDYDKLAGVGQAEPSSAVRERVAHARAVQAARFDADRPISNASMSPRMVRQYCQERLQPEAAALLKMAMGQLSLSARAFHRVLKVARTVADLVDADTIGAEHLAEAVQYRRRNQQN